MSDVPVTIAGMGVVSALGTGAERTLAALRGGECGLSGLTLFAAPADQVLPVGAVRGFDMQDQALPRTHRLARIAAAEALAGSDAAPDAIVLGTTTGGILTTESLLQNHCTDPRAYRHHGLATVAEDLARQWGCTGPVLTVSTACSSGAVALKLALEMLRCGMARRVLAGGVDSLCRLTYFGFKSLQLIDPAGARPLDRERRGMSVAEGAALLLLSADAAADGVCLLGAGLSCDAHHATAPHPEGEGALAAMTAALADAGLTPAQIDYINLHGTGTPDNDLAEGRAVHRLFGRQAPPLSSIKGAMGHPLAAAGAIEAVVAALCIRNGLLPANVGYGSPDPELGISPVTAPRSAPLKTVMSNSFGFGGNNATVIVGRAAGAAAVAAPSVVTAPLSVQGAACITGAGHGPASLEALLAGKACAGCLDEQTLSEALPPRVIRRFKRLPRMALSLAMNACRDLAPERMPMAVSIGTAWGALSETHAFLQRLAETRGQYPSPTDFVGSVHNAPAGQIAMQLGIKGANVTTSGGDYSFEQALLAADLLTRRSGEAVLVAGLDEHHPQLTPLLAPASRPDQPAADGGGALLLRREPGGNAPMLQLLAYRSGAGAGTGADLVGLLGGADVVRNSYGAILVGMPARAYAAAEAQWAAFRQASSFDGPMVDYRRLTGEFGTASAVAAVMGVAMVRDGMVPAALAGGAPCSLAGKAVLLLGLGDGVSAVRIRLP